VSAVIFDELNAIQRQHGYLPSAELEALSLRMGMPLYRLHGVASFYPHFHLAPPARAELRICVDMSCHLRGACELKEGAERMFGGLSEKEIVVRDVSCLGAAIPPLLCRSTTHL